MFVCVIVCVCAYHWCCSSLHYYVCVCDCVCVCLSLVLLFPADGAVCLIPWAALTDRRGRYLLEAHALRVVPCLGMLARIHSTLDAAAVSSFGRPGRPSPGLVSVRVRPSLCVSLSVFYGVYLQMYVVDMAYVSC